MTIYFYPTILTKPRFCDKHPSFLVKFNKFSDKAPIIDKCPGARY